MKDLASEKSRIGYQYPAVTANCLCECHNQSYFLDLSTEVL